MEKAIELLDCTLRDGAYIVDGMFHAAAIKGIIKKAQDANIDIIECGWLKNEAYTEGSSYYHVPDDMRKYLPEKNKRTTYVVMIDWDRYDLEYLPQYDGTSVDAIRVVFPHGKQKEGIEVGKQIKKKGYRVFYQAANTLAYSDEELVELAELINGADPVSLSVVDTFGAMYERDLDRIVSILNAHLKPDIKIGFHSHNNQQLSFALSMHFVEAMKKMGRKAIVDSTLCGMGRGAGNTPTELIANYLVSVHNCNYDMNQIMNAIDMYMEYFQEKYTWGYSTPYFIAGVYCSHVNNIAYLTKNHRTNAQDMKNIIESMTPEQRKKYDYDLLEQKYMENQNRKVDDTDALNKLRESIGEKTVLLVAPGKTTTTEYLKIHDYIEKEKPVVIGVNAIHQAYEYDFLFFINATRYDYAKDIYTEKFSRTPKILLSNIKTKPEEEEYIINFERVVKHGWEYFDNAVINCLRLLDKLHVQNVVLAGFDGFKNEYNESYADAALPTLNPDNQWDKLNREIMLMFDDFRRTTKHTMYLRFLTESIFNRDLAQ